MLQSFLEAVLHIDAHLIALTSHYGNLTYIILFLVIFCETGLVIFPFLPGDSLLFASGTVAALGSLNIFILLTVSSLAAILGDSTNYLIGHYFGDSLLKHPKIPINQHHIDKTHAFFAKHGGKTIFLARFVPIVRTFAPFVAGIGAMDYKTFLSYNITGGLCWVFLFTLAGYLFGNLPAVKDNFTLVILAIVFISLVPMLIEYIKSRRP